MEGTHVVFLSQIKRKRYQRTTDRIWETPEAGEVLKASRMQTSGTYIGRRQGTVAQWVVLQPIFEVCAQEQGFEVGKRQRKLLWRQEAPGEVLRAMLVEASQ